MGIAEAEHRGQPLRFSGLAFELRRAHFQLVQFGAELLVFLPRMAQVNVVPPCAAHAIVDIGGGALEGRDDENGPFAQQAHVATAAADLESEQQHLRDEYRGEQSQWA